MSIPARVVEVRPGPMTMARVDVAGRLQDCCLAYLPEARVGDHVLVSNGFAVELLDEGSAAASLAAFVELGLVVPDAATAPDAAPDVSARPGEPRGRP